MLAIVRAGLGRRRSMRQRQLLTTDNFRIGCKHLDLGAQRIHLRIELAAYENTKACDVQPDQRSDSRAKRAIHHRVVGKARDVPAKKQRREEPDHGRAGCARNHVPPRPRPGRAIAVHQAQNQ